MFCGDKRFEIIQTISTNARHISVSQCWTEDSQCRNVRPDSPRPLCPTYSQSGVRTHCTSPPHTLPRNPHTTVQRAYVPSVTRRVLKDSHNLTICIVVVEPAEQLPGTSPNVVCAGLLEVCDMFKVFTELDDWMLQACGFWWRNNAYMQR